jgi:signal transduction histidine kinase
MDKNLARIITREISGIDIRLEPKQYCHDALSVICNRLGYDFGSIILVDEEGMGSVFSAHNLPGAYPDMVSRVNVPVLSSPSGQAIKNREIVIVDDIPSEPRLKPWLDMLAGFHVETIAWVPLMSRGKAFGTYNLYSRVKRSIPEEETAMLNQLAVFFSLAIISNEYIDELQAQRDKLEREIVERKKVEKELREAKQRAEAANMVKTQFLTNMSHEVRTPLNAILGFTAILMEEESDPGRKESLEIIQGAGENLIGLITDILYLSDIEAGKLALENIDFSLVKLMEQMKRMFREEAQRKHLEFEYHIAPSVPHILIGDRYKLSKILVNMLKNAFKFTHKGGIRLNCSYKGKEETVVVDVADTGIGIPEEKQKVIFDRFMQADISNTRQYGGTGLGLTISGKLSELLGGRIAFVSEEGKGTTFTLELPIVGKNEGKKEMRLRPVNGSDR